MAMKEYELAEVTAGGHDDEYFVAAGVTNEAGVDAGQRTLLGPSEGVAVTVPAQTVWCGCLSIRFYQQFFQVDTKDVTDRWLHSVTPYKREKGFLDVVADNPDAYGPFWNSTSLIFLIALTTNLSGEGYDLTTLVTSTWVVYGFAALAPVTIWLVLHQLRIELPLIKLVCMYGYSLGPFLPAMLLCALPLPYMAFVALCAAGTMSVVFLLRSLTPIVLETNAAMAAPFMAGLALIQAIFAMTLKFGLFN